MAYLNKVMMIGNLTRAPEVRVLPKGTTVCSFGMALNRKYRDEAGNTKEEVTFVDVEAWGKTGELVSKYLVRGNPCMVEGHLRFDQWEDKTSGQKRNRLKVIADNVQFLSSPGSGSGSAGEGAEAGTGEAPAAQRTYTRPPSQSNSQPTPRPTEQTRPSSDAHYPGMEDDVPF